MNNIDNLINEYNQSKKQFQEKMKTEFKNLFIDFFQKNPEVVTVGWNQYTPYFNDGDACVFNSNADYAFATNTSDYENIEYGEYVGDDYENVWLDGGEYGDFNSELIPKHVAENVRSLRKSLGKIPDEIYLQLFGDHVTVFAHKDGFTEVEYCHD